MDHDHTDRKHGARPALQAPRRGEQTPRTDPDHGKALECHSSLRRGLARDPGNAPSPGDPRHAGIHSRRARNSGR